MWVGIVPATSGDSSKLPPLCVVLCFDLRTVPNAHRDNAECFFRPCACTFNYDIDHTLQFGRAAFFLAVDPELLINRKFSTKGKVPRRSLARNVEPGSFIGYGPQAHHRPGATVATSFLEGLAGRAPDPLQDNSQFGNSLL